ncbi:MAG: hypothetical protein IKZ53_05660 [Selenomonadaceae bacterium]|nr:hypothetical protein [Selenomonadaceae bacterium]
MKTSIFFLAVFGAELLFGNLKVDWQSWFFGVATAVSIFKLILPHLKE